jgi:hypothetical protein
VHLHFKALAGHFDAAAIGANLALQVGTVFSTFSDAWTEDLRKQIDAISAFCPPWFLHKETLLEKRDLCLQLLGNTEGYQKLGSLCKHVKDTCKTAKLVGLLPLDVLNTAKAVASQGIETVAYTFVVFYVYTELPKMTSLLAIQQACGAIRTYVCDKLHVALTDQMQEWMEALEKGDMTIANLVDKTKSAGPSPIALVSSSSSGPSPIALSTSSSSGPSPIALSTSETQPEPPQTKRARLAERVKQRS